jgi:hypothetical protein
MIDSAAGHDRRPTERYMPLSSGNIARNRHKCFKAPPDEAASQGRVWNILFGYTFRERWHCLCAVTSRVAHT